MFRKLLTRMRRAVPATAAIPAAHTHTGPACCGHHSAAHSAAPVHFTGTVLSGPLSFLFAHWGKPIGVSVDIDGNIVAIFEGGAKVVFLAIPQ